MSIMYVINLLSQASNLRHERVAEAARAAARGAGQQQARAAKVAAQRERRRASAADVRYA